jgi:hypothetical protein
MAYLAFIYIEDWPTFGAAIVEWKTLFCEQSIIGCITGSCQGEQESSDAVGRVPRQSSEGFKEGGNVHKTRSQMSFEDVEKRKQRGSLPPENLKLPSLPFARNPAVRNIPGPKGEVANARKCEKLALFL